jgi:uncharacterized membrane protein
MNENLERMELKIAKFLRVGVVVSGITMLIGWAWSFKVNVDPFASLQTYSSLTFVQSIKVCLLLRYWGRLLIYLGLIILISLPIIRVILSTYLFIKQKEKTMALIGAIVMLGLILSFSLGVQY